MLLLIDNTITYTQTQRYLYSLSITIIIYIIIVCVRWDLLNYRTDLKNSFCGW